MSIEEKLDKLSAALDRNTDAISNAVKGKAAAAPASAPKTETRTETKAKATTTKKAKAPTVEEIKDRFSKYVQSGPGDKTERLENLKAMTQHFGVDKISNGSPEQWVEALAYLGQLESGATPSYMNEPEADSTEEGADDNI